MKRDMELIRLILLNIEGEHHDLTKDYTQEQFAFHLNLLLSGVFLTQYFHGKENPYVIGGFPCQMTFTMTWRGHDFIDVARDEGFFKSVLAELKDKAVPVTIGIVLEFLKAKIKGKLGLE